ncbi:MAG: hypothetical protein MJZ61_05825 [Bacteroidales bacterium]|nr:hypothetical protein [Bacteroidales bacterium]
MKRIITMLALSATVLSASAQVEVDDPNAVVTDEIIQKYQQGYVNKGFNLMVEAEGTSNKHIKMGGASVTFGWQINPYIYVGVGQKMVFGSRYKASQEYRRKREGKIGEGKSYFTDGEGRRWYSHGYTEDGQDIFFDYYERLPHKLDENGYTIPPTVYDENGNPTENYKHIWDPIDYYDLDGCWDGTTIARLTPYICLKSNFIINNDRQVPYVDLRLGVWNDKPEFNAMVGYRFALGVGDRAINVSAGYSMADMTDDDNNNILGRESSFMIRVGMEF